MDEGNVTKQMPTVTEVDILDDKIDATCHSSLSFSTEGILWRSLDRPESWQIFSCAHTTVSWASFVPVCFLQVMLKPARIPRRQLTLSPLHHSVWEGRRRSDESVEAGALGLGLQQPF